jgi:hypothetical protein
MDDGFVALTETEAAGRDGKPVIPAEAKTTQPDRVVRVRRYRGRDGEGPSGAFVHDSSWITLRT